MTRPLYRYRWKLDRTRHATSGQRSSMEYGNSLGGNKFLYLLAQQRQIRVWWGEGEGGGGECGRWGWGWEEAGKRDIFSAR